MYRYEPGDNPGTVFGAVAGIATSAVLAVSLPAALVIFVLALVG